MKVIKGKKWDRKSYKSLKSLLLKPNLNNAEFQAGNSIRGLDKLSSGLIDYSELYLSDQAYYDIDFSSISFERARFDNCSFVRCNFSNSLLRSAEFLDCNVLSCDFTEADLFNADFVGGSLKEPILNYASTFRMSITDTKIYTISDFVPNNHVELLRHNNFEFRSFQNGDQPRIPRIFFEMRKFFYFLISLFFKSEYRVYSDFELQGDFESAHERYKQLNIALRNTGNLYDAKTAQFCAMRSRFFGTKKFTESAPLFLNLLFGYYMNPFYIFQILIVYIVLFAAFVYHNNAFFLVDGCKLDFVQAIYFSTVTTATLGYGDITPNITSDGNNILSLAPAGQALGGAILIAVYVVSLIRAEGFE